jgi:hypothetical protein
VKEIDRQYEMNNNADLDNGIYHKLAAFNKEEPKSPSLGQEDERFAKLESLINQEDLRDLQNAPSRQPCSAALPSLSLDQEDTLQLDPKLIDKVTQKYGFSREYIVRCLNNNELNYATTAYYLLALGDKVMGLK